MGWCPRWLPAGAVVVGLLLAAIAPAGADPTPRAPQVVSSDALLPEPVEALPAEKLARLERLVESAVRLRRLEPQRAVTVGLMPADALEDELRRLLSEEVPADEMENTERVLKLLRLIPADASLESLYLELLSTQIAGYYDIERDFLALVEGVEEEMGSTLLEQRGADAVWVHEIVHALQDQVFELQPELDGNLAFSDRLLAHSALVEGDATYTMIGHVFGVEVGRLPDARGTIDSMATESEDVGASTPDAQALAEAPAILRETLLFPYMEGLSFGGSLYLRGGHALVDRALREDPPTSSEQIIHPEKYLDVRDEPVEIELPDLAGHLGRDWREAARGTFGELGLRILLAERGVSADVAEAAAAGWGGDLFGLYSSDGDDEAAPQELLAWITEWDDAGEATAFAAAAAKALDGWWIQQPTPRRVSLLGGSGPASPSDVMALLAAAPARRTEPTVVDWAALGIEADDAPQPLSAAELETFLAQPIFPQPMVERIGDEPAAALDGDDPRQELDRLGNELQAGEIDVEEVLESDTVQNLMATMNQAEPVSTWEGGVLTVTLDSTAMVVVAGDGWTLRPEASTGPASFWRHTEVAAELRTSLVQVPIRDISLDTVALGARAAMAQTPPIAGGVLIDDRFETIDGRRFWTFGFESESERGLGRLTIEGSKVAMAAFFGPLEDWTALSPWFEAALGSIALNEVEPAAEDSP
ncbi:MAG: hypothetical protein AAGN46_14470 [Acidobacteriota bacterium]